MTQGFGETRGGAPVAFLRTELFRATRFGVVGAIATCVHMLVVWSLIENTRLPVMLANLLAFSTAFGLSFAGHYYWTFRSPGNAARAMRRFFLISVTAFSTNSLLLAGLLRLGWPSPAVGAVSAAAVIPAITFLVSRLWAFREERVDKVV
jgi:putative flippase GtrA